MLLKTTWILLCMLCVTGAQWSLLGSLNNLNNVATFLSQHCSEMASFLPAVCGVAAVGPACCGIFSIIDMCSPSCGRSGAVSPGMYGTGNQGLKAIMYDPTVCAALTMVGQTQCQGYRGMSGRCSRLNCLMNMLCFPAYNFACFYRSGGTNVISSHEGGVGVNGIDNPQANTGNRGTTIEENCFELPELADGELTGLLDDTYSALRQCPHQLVNPDCKDKLRYRTIDGSCNNLHNPKWGKSFEPQKRLLPAELVNDELPRILANAGDELPMPRYISTGITTRDGFTVDVSNMVMAWGQFIDHDFTGTPVTKNGSKAIKCCGDIPEDLKAENGGPCHPITIPHGDPMAERTCMEFVRSLPYSYPNGTRMVPREQINTLTSFLDGSAVYGNTQEVLDKLKGEGGMMKVKEGNMLPENPSGTCKKEQKGDYCLLAGDHRVNVFVGLGALHTLFVREHNRIATILSQLNPAWDSDTLFEETRRIVSAQFQHVTYVEWLPVLLDDKTMTDFRLKAGDYDYDPNLNPTVSNVFSTAAFRFGHSQVKQAVKIGPGPPLALQDTLMRPGLTLNRMTDIFRGLVEAPTDDVDQFFAEGLTDHMFETNSTTMDGLDLVSINIQRGRDHGLPSFNKWRQFCGLPVLENFDTTDMAENLGKVYKHVDDIDLFVGLVCESHSPGAKVGPTLACLLGHQFRDIKLGDRFFYETQGQEERFSAAQLQEIKSLTLAKIICDNNPDIKEIQPNVFKLEDPVTNPSTPCEKLPGMDLRYWRVA